MHILSFFSSFNNYLITAYCKPGTVIGDIVGIRQIRTSSWEWLENKKRVVPNIIGVMKKMGKSLEVV